MCGLALVIREFNMTNKELAEILEIKPQSLNDWLKSKRKIPPTRLEQLSAIFNLSQDYFLKDESEYTELDRLEVKMSYLKKIEKQKYTEVDSLEVKQSYLKKTNKLIEDPTMSPYRFWSNSDEIRRTQALIENKKLLNGLEVLINKVGNIGEDDYSVKSVKNYYLLEKIAHVLRNEDENKEIADNLRALFKEYKM